MLPGTNPLAACRTAWLAVATCLLLPAALAAPVVRRTPPRPASRRAAPPTAAARPNVPLVIPGPEAVIPVAEIRPGMKGYGLTVFKGATVERFDVTVLGVMPSAYMGKPLVLIRMSGGPITGRGAYLIQGMSGSPIYVNDRLVGAFSMGSPYSREPIGMVTPIEAMMEALDEKLPSEPVGMASAPLDPAAEPSAIAASQPSILSGPNPPLARGIGMGMAPLTTPVMVSGVSPRNLEAAAGLLRPFNLAVQAGAGRLERPVQPAPSLKPGSGLGVSLITGDMDLTAVGTVTWRKGDQLLAFGHPFFQIGPAQFPISTVWVHDVVASFQTAFKIASPARPAGTLLHDRAFSVLAKVGPTPAMVPVTCNVDDRITGKKRVFRVQIANHPLLLGQLAALSINEAVMEAHPVPGDVTAEVQLALETEQLGRIERRNTFYDPAQIEMPATQEVAQLVALLSGNNLRRVPLKSLEANVVLTAKRPTATIERIYVKQDRYEPGETIEVGVVVRPYRGEPLVTPASIRVPESATGGRAMLMVSGGATRFDPALLAAGGAPGTGSPSMGATPAPTRVTQLVRRFLERERNNQLATRLIFPSSAVNVDGVKLSQLPSHIAEVMRSSRATGLRVERDETKSVQDTAYVLQGVHGLQVTIARKDMAEKPVETTPSGATLPGLPDLGSGLPVGRGGGNERSEGGAGGFELALPETGNSFFSGPTPEIEEKKGAPAPPATEPVKPGEPAKPEPPKVDGARPAGSDPPAAAADATILGRQPATWKQTSLADFQRGTLIGAGVTASGEVRLAASLKPLYESAEQYIWSLAAIGNAVYAGTGNGGSIYRVTPDGKSELFCKTGELEVHALARDARGQLYAGTSPNGKVLRVAADGKATELLSLNPSPNGDPIRDPLPEARYVLCLAVGGDGTVYAGTGEGGLVYRIDPSGKGQALFDCDQPAITGLARDAEGSLYVSTAPRGTIYRIKSDGSASTYFDRAKGAVSSLSVGAGALHAACGNVIYRIESPESVTAISDSKRAQFLAIDWDEQGRLLAASANVGAIFRAEPAAEGTFESTVHDAKSVARWGRIRWTAVLSAAGALQIETRSGNTPEPDPSWSDWSAPRAEPMGTFVTSPPARYLQYRAALRSGGSGTAALRELSVIYLPRNEAPTLTVTAPAGGEVWRGAQTLKWTGADPNKDTLTYQVFFSDNGGTTWKPVGEKTSTAPPAAAPAPAATSRPAATLEAALLRYREEVALRTDIGDDNRRELISQAEQLVSAYQIQNQGGAAPQPDEKPQSPPATATKPAVPPKPGVTRESSLAWDTTQVADGIYVIKIVATDRASNPSEPLSVEKISEPVIIVNRPPNLFVPAPAIQYTPEKAAVVLGVCQARVTLKGAQFRVGEGEWTAIDAADGIWDSGLEQFRFSTEPLAPGEHTLQIKCVDVAGNVTTAEVKLAVL